LSASTWGVQSPPSWVNYTLSGQIALLPCTGLLSPSITALRTSPYSSVKVEADAETSPTMAGQGQGAGAGKLRPDSTTVGHRCWPWDDHPTEDDPFGKEILRHRVGNNGRSKKSRILCSPGCVTQLPLQIASSFGWISLRAGTR